jgi:hypothetical protein
MCGLVLPGPLPKFLPASPESMPWSLAATAAVSAARLVRRTRVAPPGLVEECGHGLQLTSANYLTRGQGPRLWKLNCQLFHHRVCVFRERQGKR